MKKPAPKLNIIPVPTDNLIRRAKNDPRLSGGIRSLIQEFQATDVNGTIRDRARRTISSTVNPSLEGTKKGIVAIPSHIVRLIAAETTAISRRFRIFSTRNIAGICRRLPRGGMAARSPTTRLEAPSCSARATRKTPPERTVMLSAATPSLITDLRASSRSSSFNFSVGSKIMILPHLEFDIVVFLLPNQELPKSNELHKDL